MIFIDVPIYKPPYPPFVDDFPIYLSIDIIYIYICKPPFFPIKIPTFCPPAPGVRPASAPFAAALGGPRTAAQHAANAWRCTMRTSFLAKKNGGCHVSTKQNGDLANSTKNKQPTCMT